MKYFRIKNWEKYQHKDTKRFRGPMKWIRFETSIIDDYKTRTMNTHDRLTWMLLLALAGRTCNRVASSPDFLRSILGLRKKPNLRLFEELDLIEHIEACEEHASSTHTIQYNTIQDSTVHKPPPPPSEGNSFQTKKPPKKNLDLKASIVLTEAHEVILYLNKMASKNFCPQTFESLISSALKKFKLDDLKKIIDLKVKDPFFMQNPQYLRPATLFGSERKIDQYLNEGSPMSKADVRFTSNMEVAKRVLERRNLNAK